MLLASTAWRGRHQPPRAVRRPPLQERKLSPLQRGGTLQGAAAAGKDASEKFKAAAEGKATTGPVLQIVDGRFRDYRWKAGRWDLKAFRKVWKGHTSTLRLCLWQHRVGTLQPACAGEACSCCWRGQPSRSCLLSAGRAIR